MKRVSYTHLTHSAAKVVAPLALALLVACTQPSRSAFYNRGGPESLIDVSSEVVNLSVAGKTEVAELSDWIANDQPSRAELFCDAASPSCKDAKKVLQIKGVETNVTPSMNNTVTLVYERILARDCNQRYIDKGFSMYNANQPATGCSVAANMVQHVSDKREFINPSLSDDPMADSLVKSYRRGLTPVQQNSQPYSVNTPMGSGGGSSGGSQ